MRLTYVAACLYLFAFGAGICAQEIDSVAQTTLLSARNNSSDQDSLPFSASPTAEAVSSDTSFAAPAPQKQPPKLMLIKRKYNSRQQVLLATGMMIFVVGIMTMAEQWNPR
jgi:hypothetical protein